MECVRGGSREGNPYFHNIYTCRPTAAISRKKWYTRHSLPVALAISPLLILDSEASSEQRALQFLAKQLAGGRGAEAVCKQAH